MCYLLVHQKSPLKTRHESENPLSSRIEQYNRTGRRVVCAHSSSYSEWNVDQTWSSQEWKSDELMDDRTERPVVCSQRAHQFVIEDDETESELSLGSRSFFHRVNDQVRKRQKQSSTDATEDREEHSVIWG